MSRAPFLVTILSLFALSACAASPSTRPIALTIPQHSAEHLGGVPQRIYQACQKQARYLLSTVHPWKEEATLLLLTDSRSGEHWIRPNTGAIQGFAFLVRFGPYDEKIVGLSRQRLLNEIIIPMTRYVVTTHVTGTRPTSDGKKWGDAWQSAHWTAALARGAWWVWDDFPDDLRQGVQRVVAHEADRIAAATPPHQLKYDTKSEENAWNSDVLCMAMILMPDDPRRPGWERNFQKWVMSSWLRPADEMSGAVVDGRTVAEQFTGANVFDDYTLENHGFVHPDYMTATSLSVGCLIDYGMIGRKPPEALLYNVSGIYENLKWFWLPDGGFVYPNGQDWQLFRNPGWLSSHLLMAVYARDPDAWTMACTSLDTLEKMQARNDSGAIYRSDEFAFASTQTDLVKGLSRSWLMLQLADNVPDSFRPRLGVRRLDSGKIILHRTPKAIHTLSWGARTMIQCVPLRMDRIVSPDERNGIGYVRLKGQAKALPVKMADATVAHAADGFTADLVIDHGDAARANIHCESRADGSMLIRETLVALRAISTAEIATGQIGVLNNPHWIHETGQRRIALDGQEITVRSQSGQSVASDKATCVLIDETLEIQSKAPLRVHYQSAAKPERSRVTDRLYLNYLAGPREWKEGQETSRYEVVIRVK